MNEVKIDKRLSYLYDKIKPKESDPPLTRQVKERMLPDVLSRWKKYTEKPTGGRQMVARPLEDHVMDVIEEQIGADVKKRKKFLIWKDMDIRIDGLIEKQPKTLISCKVTLAPEAFRESFSYAYFAKQWHGMKNIRFYIVATYSVSESSKKLVEAGKPYVDGIYYLSEHPYLDELLNELKRMYS